MSEAGSFIDEIESITNPIDEITGAVLGVLVGSDSPMDLKSIHELVSETFEGQMVVSEKQVLFSLKHLINTTKEVECSVIDEGVTIYKVVEDDSVEE